jgi:TRAP-type uncharacterized transport system substrate-binding protein
MKLNRRFVLALVASTAILSGTAIAQQRVFFGIATGGTGGTYYPLGGMLAQLISNKATVDGKKLRPQQRHRVPPWVTPSC